MIGSCWTGIAANHTVTNASPNGAGSLGEALQLVQPGDLVLFDPAIFPPSKPAAISPTWGLTLSQSQVTIDASDAGVILDGHLIGTNIEETVLDSFVLSINGQSNSLVNGDFSQGLSHWSMCDERASHPRRTTTNDVDSPPYAYVISSVAPAGDANTFYDTGSGGASYASWPANDAQSPIWIPATAGATVRLDFRFKSLGDGAVNLMLRQTTGGFRHIGEFYFPGQVKEWQSGQITATVPADGNALAINIRSRHSQRYNCFYINGSSNVIRGLQIVGFPGVGIGLSGQGNQIGGNRNLGRGPLGQGNLISGNGSHGIILAAGCGDTIIRGNYIGTDLSGRQAFPNFQHGIWVADSARSRIGGSAAGEGNVLSGNGGPGQWATGISLTGSGTHHTEVYGNLIGLDATGTSRLQNAGDGLWLGNGAHHNTIGGSSAGQRNVISGNLYHGLSAWGDGTIENSIQGNYIGVNAAGTESIGNGGAGLVLAWGPSDNLIGGHASGQGNVVAGNAGDGIHIPGSHRNILEGNWVGITPQGNRILPNSNGIHLFGGSSGNRMGGEASGAANTIAGNLDAGIQIDQPGTIRNPILRNSIHSNSGPGIRVVNGGNSDVPPARLLNNTIATISGYTGPGYRVEVFSDDTEEGKFYEGTTTADDQGFFQFTASSALRGKNPTVTVTDPDGNTSVFAYIAHVSNTQDSGPGSLRYYLENAMSGQVIQFDPLVFPPTAPATIYLSTALPGIWQSNIIIDASNAGVILDGSSIGTTPELSFVDDLRLTLGDSGNVLQNGDFAAGLTHWSFLSESPRHVVEVTPNSPGHSSPSIQVRSTAQDRSFRMFYDTQERSIAFSNWPNSDSQSSAWIPASPGQLVTVECSFKAPGGGNMILTVLHASGAAEDFAWFNMPWMGTQWDKGTLSAVVPSDGVGVALRIELFHSQRWHCLFWINSSSNVIQGLQIRRSPGTAIALVEKADHNLIGGDRSVGQGPTGQGNLISDNGNLGVEIRDAASCHNLIVGNLIGTDTSGKAALGNFVGGITIYNGASSNLVGGITPAKGNIISGNGISPFWALGIGIRNVGTTGNRIIGNRIGVDIDGTAAVPNQGDGVTLTEGTSHNLIGGSTPSEANVISANKGHGLSIYHVGSSNNRVLGNFVGTDRTGTKALGNAVMGIALANGCSQNQIGGNRSWNDALLGEGNLISGNESEGLHLWNANHNTVWGNIIGLAADGTTNLGNGGNGLGLYSGSQDNQIGDGLSVHRNIISGNGTPARWANGINVWQSSSNRFLGNYIGVDKTGAAAVGNRGDGCSVGDSSQGNRLGGSGAGQGNVISGNGGHGVRLQGNDASVRNNIVQGNWVGTDAEGRHAVPNLFAGIQIQFRAENNQIGGQNPGEGNVISGNGLASQPSPGLFLNGDGVIGNVIEGNLIGLAGDGASPLGNTSWGIGVVNGARGNRIGPRNIVSANQGPGLALQDRPTRLNTVTQNSLFANAGEALRIANGANDGIAPPIFSQVTSNEVAGLAGPNHVVEIFSDAGSDARFFEGRVVADSTGQFRFTQPAGWQATGRISATDTAPDGNTSPLADSRRQPELVFWPIYQHESEFEEQAGAEWSRQSIQTSPNGSRRFLGRFGNETVSLSLSNLPPHSTVVLSLDVLVIHSWDGNSASGVGPDLWEVSVAGGAKLLRTTFGLYDPATSRQAYPGFYPGGDFEPCTGASETNSLGFQFSRNGQMVPMDAVYRVHLTFEHSGTALALNFTGSGLQALNDESWGLDNVKVSLIQGLSQDTPAILMQPQDQSVVRSQSAWFRVLAAGKSPLHYQWKREGQDLPGATNATLVIPHVQATNTGAYSVEVTHQPGSVVSAPALLSLLPGTVHLVASTADSGSGTLREALLQASTGDTIRFDPTVFPTAAPAPIGLVHGLPSLAQGGLTLDASDAGVILDGSQVGAVSETILVDDVQLTLDSGANLVLNGDFNAGTRHWSSCDDGSGHVRGVNSSDYVSAPQSLQIASQAHGKDANTFYDTQDRSFGFTSWPASDSGSSIWIPARSGQRVSLRFQYKIPGSGTAYILLRQTGGSWRNLATIELTSGNSSWQQGAIDTTVPSDGSAVAVQFRTRHSERWQVGLHIASSYNSISGLQIVRFPGSGMMLSGNATHNQIGGDCTRGQGNLLSGNNATGLDLRNPGVMNNVISGNKIGTDISGTQAWGNGDNGIHLTDQTSGNLIGGSSPGQRNVISGNRLQGIALYGNSSGNLVSGNLIGLDVIGETALPNQNGIDIQSPGNQIGDTALGGGNIISGNRVEGIVLNGSTASSNVIIGNFIGTDRSGTKAVGNGWRGIAVNGAAGNRIGGASPAEQNVISGNLSDGIILNGRGANNQTWRTVVQGNLIGTQADGLTPLGNRAHGILVTSAANNNLIGGDTIEAGNVITANSGDGVNLDGSGVRGNRISHNSIYDNAGQGIRLLNSANAQMKPPSNLQQTPDSISGLTSPGACVEAYSDTATEGRWFEGATNADSSGHFTLTTPINFTGSRVNLTATDTAGNTSQFGGSPLLANRYSADFENGAGTEWSSSSVTTSPVGNQIFLGEFANQTVTLTLSNVPPHNAVALAFDLLILKSWDGNDAATGPDFFDLRIDDGPVLLHTTFCTHNLFTPRFQAFPEFYPGGSHPTLTGADETGTLGYLWTFSDEYAALGTVSLDAVYHLSYHFAHTNTTLCIRFSGSNLQDVSDESWGLDNVQVTFTNLAFNAAPVILAQPQDRSSQIGADTYFQVVAQGAPPLVYQWRHQGQPLEGATNAALLLTHLDTMHVGQYDVVVANSFGSVTSRVARLDLDPLYIVNISPTNAFPGSLKAVRLTFSGSMDTNSFSPTDDIIAFNGPTGSVPITGFHWEHPSLLELQFAALTNRGSYQLILGPQILDLAGRSLDQDRDRNPGENPDDRFEARLAINMVGMLLTDTTWGPEEGPIVAAGSITVPSGVTLTLRPGTILKFPASAALNITGNLSLPGTVEQPIVLTSIRDDSAGGDTNGDGATNSPVIGDWAGLNLTNGTGRISINHGIIRYANVAFFTLQDQSSIDLRNSQITHCGAVLQLWGINSLTDVLVENTLVARNTCGFNLHGSSRTVLRNVTIVDNAQFGIELGDCILTLENCIVAFNAVGLRHVGPAPSLLLRSCLFNNNIELDWAGQGVKPEPFGADGNLNLDPLFENRAGGNYGLAAGSPAIDSGRGSGAPSTDMLELARYDDLGMPNRGYGSPSFTDMGAFERQSDTPNADLAVVFVSAPSPEYVKPGESFSLSWRISNTGIRATQSSWVDSVFLSEDPYLSIDDLAIETKPHASTLAPGESYDELTTVTVPTNTSGVRYLIIQANASRLLPEPIEANNILLAPGALLIDLPALGLNQSTLGTVKAGEWSYIRFDAIAGKSVVLQLDGTAVKGALSLYVRQSQPPTLESFDGVSHVPNSLDQDYRIQAPTNGVYYIGVYGAYLPNGTASFKLSAIPTALDIRLVSPNLVGNAGQATLKIEGDAFANGVQAQLRDANGLFLEGTVLVQDSTTLYATFDLLGSNAVPGAYDLIITNPDQNRATRTQALEIVSGGIPEFRAHVVMPGMTRPGRTIDVRIEYENPSLIDVPSPLLTLESTPPDCEWQLPGEDTWRPGPFLRILALSPEGPLTMLRSGQSAEYVVRLRVPLRPDDIYVKLSSVGATPNDGSLTQIDWLALQDEIRPAGVSSDYWVPTWTAFTQMVGHTWGDYVNLLCHLASLIPESAGSPFSVNDLYRLLITQAEALAWPTFSGRIHDVSPQPLPYTGQIHVVDEQTKVAGAGWILRDGSFAIPGLPSGTYQVSFDDYVALEQGLQVVVKASGLQDVEIPVLRGATVSGSVSASPGGPGLAGITALIARNAEHQSFAAEIASDGSYVLSPLPPGEYSWEIDSDYYIPRQTNTFVVGTGSMIQGLNIELDQGASIAGQVVFLPGDTTASQYTVEVSSAAGDSRIKVFSVGMAYQVGGLVAGTYQLKILAEGCASVVVNDLLVRRGETLTLAPISVIRSGFLEGRITAAFDNRPIPAAMIQAKTVDQEVLATAVTDTNGCYQVRDLPPGSYLVEVSASGFWPCTNTLSLVAETTTTFSTALATSGRIRGRVTDLEAVPLGNIPIQIVDEQGRCTATVSGPDGKYEVVELAPGRYTVSIGSTGPSILYHEQVTLTVQNPEQQLDYRLPLVATISGTVFAADGITPSSNVLVALCKAKEILAFTESDEQGHFSFATLAQDRFDLEAFSATAVYSCISNIQCEPGMHIQNLNIVAGHITVTGRVRNGPALNPATNALISITRSDKDKFLELASTEAAEDGSFSFSGLPSGEYVLRVSAPGCVSLSRPLSLTGGAPSSPLDLVIQSGAQISGRVVDQSQRQPVSDALVVIVDETTSTQVSLNVTGTDGEYLITGLAPGSYEISVLNTPFAAAHASFQVIGEQPSTLNFELGPASSSLAGIIRDQSGRVLPGVEIQVLTPEGRLRGMTTSHSDGSFSVLGLESGRYLLNASAAYFYPTTSAPLLMATNQELAGLSLVLNAAATDRKDFSTTNQILAGLALDISSSAASQEPRALQLAGFDFWDSFWGSAQPACEQCNDEWQYLMTCQRVRYQASEAAIAATHRYQGHVVVITAKIMAAVAITYGIGAAGSAAQAIAVRLGVSRLWQQWGIKIMAEQITSTLVSAATDAQKSNPSTAVRDLLVDSGKQAGSTAAKVVIAVGRIKKEQSFQGFLPFFNWVNRITSALDSLSRAIAFGIVQDWNSLIASAYEMIAAERTEEDARKAETKARQAYYACKKKCKEKEQEPKEPNPGDGEPQGGGSTDNGTSQTPEDLFGPSGYDAPGTATNTLARYLTPDQWLPYRIEFWNETNALVPTQDAIIEDTLDPAVYDLASFQFTRFGFLKWDVQLQGAQVIDHRIDLRPDMNFAVDVTGTFNPETGKIRWWFHCVDPMTGDYPEDPMAGFLPPFNPQTGYELGWVEFIVKAKPNLPTGVQIKNQAFVEFDFVGDLLQHPAPKYGPWINTVEGGTPISSVLPLPQETQQASFLVQWTGQDEAGGTGIADFDIFVSDNQGPWQAWLRATTATSATFLGQPGHRYGFCSIARDYVGHQEDPPSLPDTAILIVDAQVPSLAIRDTNGLVHVSWPRSAQGFVLQSTRTLGPGVSWQSTTNEIETAGDRFEVQINPESSSQYYRLRHP